MQTLHRFPTPDALYDGAADLVVVRIQEAITERGRCSIALAGGSTPKALYERLAAAPRSEQISWRKVTIWFGDERCVRPDNPASNFRMANEALLGRVPLQYHHIHRIEGELSPDVAAEKYAALLAARPPLDIVLLGMGDDGHTASIFPGTPDPDPEARVIATKSPIEPTDRVTLTLRTISEARSVYFLVSGAGKAARLAEVLAQRGSGAPSLPSARVAAANVTFLVDAAAHP